MFLVQHECFFCLKTNNKNTIFGQEGGCNTTFFINLSFAKCEKLSFFFLFFWGGQILVDVQETL